MQLLANSTASELNKNYLQRTTSYEEQVMKLSGAIIFWMILGLGLFKGLSYVYDVTRIEKIAKNKQQVEMAQKTVKPQEATIIRLR